MDAVVATLITTRKASPLPPRYRPLIGMLAFPSPAIDEASEQQGQVMSADLASIQAILDAGGEVRLIPPRLPFAGEDPIELALQSVLAFDGLFLTGGKPLANQGCAGQPEHPHVPHPDTVFEWWSMLMPLVARQTLTPLFGTGLAGNLINLALGGTVRSHQAGQWSEHGIAENGLLHAAQGDPWKLERCLGGANLPQTGDDFLSRLPAVETCCSFEEVPDQLAPSFLAWQWCGDTVTGFGYAGPDPWFALATLLPAESEARKEASLAHCLFRSFLEACSSYAGSLHEALRSVRMQDLLLRKLYREDLTRPFLQEPLDFSDRGHSTD